MRLAHLLSVQAGQGPTWPLGGEGPPAVKAKDGVARGASLGLRDCWGSEVRSTLDPKGLLKAPQYLAKQLANHLLLGSSGLAPSPSPQGVPVAFMRSDGGLTPMEAFSGSRAILSGPAGGVVGYAVTSYSRTEGLPVIGFDMGGEWQEGRGSAALSRAGGGREADRVLLQGPPPM